MFEIKNSCIQLKENIDKDDYDDIKGLEKLCIETDNTSLKLEIDYKLNKSDEKSAQKIMLQVDAINKNALNLYKSCGFEETNTMDYFKLNKENH